MPIDEYSGSDEVGLERPLINGVLVTNSNTPAKFKIQLPNGGRDFLLVKTRVLPEFQYVHHVQSLYSEPNQQK